MSNFEYNPAPVLKQFMQDDSLLRFVTGPVGSGKSTAMVFEMVRRSYQQAPGPDGVRRSRWVICRNTLQQIKQTCLETIIQLLRPAITIKVSESKITLLGKNMVTEWIMLPLERPEDQRRLLSLELTGGWVSEAREVNPSLVRALLSRVGRYPSKMDGGCTWYGVICESNGFSIASPWYELLEENKPSRWAYFRQPGGLEPDAENTENLPNDYYGGMMDGNTDDWINIHVHNIYGDDLSGTAVFRSSFIPDFHIAKEELPVTSGNVLCIGMDFARAPAAIIGQIDRKGRLVILKELCHQGMGVEKFTKDFLVPELMTDRFANLPSYIVGDPSGRAKSQIGEESVFDMLAGLNLLAMPAQTNSIDPRLRAVEKWLLQQRAGAAAMLFDPIHCPMLIKALREKYKYRIKKDGQTEDKPSKDRPWSDLADALQYLCLGLSNTVRGRALSRMQPRRPTAPPLNPRAWT